MVLKNYHFCRNFPFFLIFFFLDFLIISLFFNSFPSIAKEIYISQIESGSKDGSSCTNSYSVSWFNTPSNWGFGPGKISPGDTVHLCGLITSQLIFQGSGLPDAPITLLFEPGAKIQPPSHCDGDGCINMANKSYLIVDGGTTCGYINKMDIPCNGKILNTNLNPSGDNIGILGNNCKNCEVRNLEIGPFCNPKTGGCGSRSYGIANIGGNALGYYWKVHNNYVHGIGTGIVYFPSNINDNGYECYNNYTYNNSHHIDIVSNGNYQTGYLSKALIYDNHIRGTPNWDAPGCPTHQNGIYSWSIPGSNNVYISGLEIYNNFIDGDWGGCTSSMIWTEGTVNGAVTNVKIYNNVIAPSNYIQVNNGLLGADGYGPIEVYNNTILGLGKSDVCFQSNSGAVGTVFLTFKNNLIVGCNTLININNPPYNPIIIVDFDYNLYAGTTVYPWVDQQGPYWYSTLSSWQYRCSCDLHSLHGNTNAYANVDSRGVLQFGSPAIDAGISIFNIFNTDGWGTPRPQGLAWDIGAFEYKSSAPSAPRNLKILP